MQTIQNFNGLSIAPKMLGILEQLKFTIPTPIQNKSIPVAIAGKDIVGIAQTGTGKTLAYGIPMIQRLSQDKSISLILLPTRELAIQVDEHLRMFSKRYGLRTAVLIGGIPIDRQLLLMSLKPRIIIATPGRMNDHIARESVNLSDIKTLILDEADRMFDMGFLPQIMNILMKTPKERQTMLFSATMNPYVSKIASQHMDLPVRIEATPSGTAAERVDHEMIILRNENKHNQLKKILKEYPGTILIFARTKFGVKNLCRKIKQTDRRVAEIHSDRTQAQRKEAMDGFKKGRYRILVATDIASRGIDIRGIELVLNYDLPDNLEDYVHRIGRTGRAGKAGRAISFALQSQVGDIKKIEQIINQDILQTRLAKIDSEDKNYGKNGFKSHYQEHAKHSKPDEARSAQGRFNRSNLKKKKKYTSDSGQLKRNQHNRSKIRVSFNPQEALI
ncbi:DEAD/DEAH box helicase [bacterium]|nr:DEAD/DEAH box helicase [bacterium]